MRALRVLWREALWVAIAAFVAAFMALPSAARAQGANAVDAARQLIAATPELGRPRLQFALELSLREDWHYTPRRRDGLAWNEMTPAQGEWAIALLRSALTDAGLALVRNVMALEAVLREVEGSSFRDPLNYAWAIYGRPGEGGWGWRVEGHHLSLHFSLDGARYVSTLPQFIGANPATVPHDVAGAPPAGFRALGALEDQARRWLASLSPAQRQTLVIDARPYGDIVSRNSPRARALDARGLTAGALDEAQRAALLSLVGAFAAHLQPELADARMARMQASAAGSLRVAWAGSVDPGKPHYFRIQGASFLIEYDNSGGNHVHSVWRDFEGDFGRDVLREHYQRPARR
jgi:hypothetical protein